MGHAAMPRLVAVDMDGTFLDSTGNYDRSRFARIHQRLRAREIRFVVASGNQYWQLRQFFTDHPEVCYIAENGAVVGTSEQIIRTSPFRAEVAAAALEAVDTLDGVLTVQCCQQASYAMRSSDQTMVDDIRRYQVRLDLVDSWAEVGEPLLKIALACRAETTARLMEILGGTLPHGAVAVSSGHGSIDIIADKVNKATALTWLGESFGIAPEEMVAFGDGGNDLEMLTVAGIGVAMANAPESIREVADEVTGSNDEDGVLDWLEQNLAPPLR